MSKFNYKGFLKNNPLLKEIHDKESLLHKLGDWDDALITTHDGREFIIINPDNGNLDNEGLYNDNTFFALTQDGDEVELSYSDVASLETGKSYTGMFDDEYETDYSEKRKGEADYVSEEEGRANISNRLRQSVKDDSDDEDGEGGIEIGTEPVRRSEPTRQSNAEKRSRGHKSRQANIDRGEQDRLEKEKRKAAAQEKGSDILLSNRHTINAYSGKIKAIDGSGKVYDSLDDAPPYFKNTLSDRDKRIVYQITNVSLEEELQGKDVNALALVTLDSVGHYLDIDTAEVYPINADDTPDFKNAFSLHDEIDEEFINALSERDRLVVARYTDQVM